MTDRKFMSESIAELAEALSKAQGEIQHAAKDKRNPFFESAYADLASVWDACKGPLSRNNLSVTQLYGTDLVGKVELITCLLHSSGEYVLSYLPVNPVKNDPQGLVSAMTYMKRGALSAIAGVAPAEKPTKEDVQEDDDDGESASGRSPVIISPKGPVIVPKVSEDIRVIVHAIRAAQKQLFLSDDELKAALYRDFRTETMRDLKIDELERFYKILCDTKKAATEVDPQWLKEAGGPIA